MVDPPVVRRGRRPAITVGSQPVWSWHDAAASVAFLSVAGAVILTAQAIAVAVAFNPDVGGSPTRGLIVLVVGLFADVLLVAKRPRPRTEVHPWGLVLVGLWSRRTLQWDEVAFFGSAGVVLVDGSCAWMPEAHRVASAREALNRRCGVDEPELPYPWGDGLVELPTEPANEPRAAGSSGVLHAVGPNGAPACGPTEALCLPTFRRWRAQDHGCLSVCSRCQELVPLARRSRVPFLPLCRPAQPEPGGEWVTAHDRSSAWGVFLAWLVCAFWLLPVIGLWMLYRWLTMSSRLGADGLEVRRFLRTRRLPWSELVTFEWETNAVVALTRLNRRVRLESLHHLGSDMDTFVATLNLVIERMQTAAVEVETADRVVAPRGVSREGALTPTPWA